MTDHLHALAMRTKASEFAARITAPIGCAKVPFEIATAILALPLEADHAALVMEACKLDAVKELVAAAKALRSDDAMTGSGGSLADILERFDAALLALETP